MASKGVGSSLGTTYVKVVPSLEGEFTEFEEKLAEAVGASTEDIGKKLQEGVTESGEEAGGKFSKGFNAKLAIGGAAITAAVTAGGKALYELGETWDDFGDTIRVGTGATGKDLDAFIASGKKVAKNVPVDLETVSSTLADINTRLGLSGPELEEFTESMIHAGHMLGESLDINTVSGFFTAFGVESSEMNEQLDFLWKASQDTGLGINQIAESARQGAPALKALGFSTEEAVSAIAYMDKSGLDATKMLSGMAKSLPKLTEEGEGASDAFSRVSTEIQEMSKSGDAAGAIALATDLFGVKNAPAFIDALNSGSFAVEDLVKNLESSNETIAGAAEDTYDFAESWAMFKNSAMVAIEPVATMLFETLGGALTSLAPILETVFKWFEDNEGVTKLLVFGLGGLAAVIGTVMTVMGAWNVISGTVGTVMKGLTTASKLFNLSLLANPMVLIVTAIIAIIVLLVVYWDEVVGVFGAGWDWITEKAAQFGEWFMNTVKGWGQFFVDLWTGAKESWTAFWGWVDGKIKGIAAGFKKFFGGIGQGIADVFTKAFTAVTNKVNGIWDGVTGFFTKIPEFISKAAGMVIDVFKAYVNTVLKGVNWLIGGLNKIHFDVPDWVPGVGGSGFGINIPKIPLMATGGDVMGPTLLIAGEKDPETIMNRGVANRAYASMSNALDALLSGGGGVGGGMVFNLAVENAEGLDEEALSSRLFKRIERELAWNSRR